MTAALPLNEAARLDALGRLHILDTPPEEPFDDLTRLAALVCGTPMALISLVDANRQWFKSRIGIDSAETPRSVSFCAHAILQEELFIVPDAFEDARFDTNPMVTDDPNIRFYAGMPISGPEGHAVGTLCVLDNKPRQLPEEKQLALRVLARSIAAHFQIRQQLEQLRLSEFHRTEVEQNLRVSEASLRAANARLQQMASTDVLTGLKNRRAFDERLQQEWKLSSRLHRDLSLLMIDIDHFKRFNDTFGHTFGDRILQHVASHLRSSVRESDTTARYGGEEFAILLPATDIEQATHLADNLRKSVAETNFLGQTVTVSIGVAADLSVAGDAEGCSLVGQADAALYAAKRAGRNRVERATWIEATHFFQAG